MRIAVIGPQYPDSLERNIAFTLREMGHKVFTIDDHHGLISSKLLRVHDRRVFGYLRSVELALMRGSLGFERWVYRRVCAHIQRFRPEVVISVTGQMPPSVVEELKQRTEATMVVWWQDAVSNLGRQYLLAAPYDFLFFKDRYVVTECRNKLGKNNVYFLPECCNPAWHRRVRLSDKERAYYECDIAIAGSMYWNRVLLLETLLGHNYSIKIWGGSVPKWLKSPVLRFHQGRYVAELEKAKAFNAAKIVLSNFHIAEVTSFSGRVFEVAGCGAFQLCEYRAGLEEFFEIGWEIDVFHNTDELVEKVDYYLAHPREREVMADRAYERAQRDHTYQRRLSHMLAIIESMRCAGKTP